MLHALSSLTVLWGSASTHDQDVFSFYPEERFCNGFEEVLSLYREIVPHLRLAGPTSFAPVIEMAMTIVERSGGQYHVLLIIADGQVLVFDPHCRRFLAVAVRWFLQRFVMVSLASVGIFHPGTVDYSFLMLLLS